MKKSLSLIGAALVSAFLADAASAAMIITEVDPSGSTTGNGYSTDWFELTNTGNNTVNIAGWKMDDSHASFSTHAVSLTGITSIAAGQSVIFLEDSGLVDATIQANFISTWFGSNAPAGLSFGFYGGSGVGLSQSGDAVNIYDSTGAAIASVNFGAAPASGATFDNSAGLNNATLTVASVAGVQGAFNSYSTTNNEIGSPGVAPVPLPAAVWLLLSGLGIVGSTIRRRS